MNDIKQRIDELAPAFFSIKDISILPIRDDYDLWYATVECQLAPEQVDFVNPAGFSIGRAYLHPESNVPCIIRKGTVCIGYIVLRTWFAGKATSFSYYLDKDWQGCGYGKTAAKLAVQILKCAVPELPIKLSAEKDNEKAHRLYQSIGFSLSDELDGDDLVFVYE